MTSIPYTTYSREDWQNLLQQAIHAHDVQAVRTISNALNEYDRQEVPPTTGQMLGAEAKGVLRTVPDMMRGVGQTLADVAGGHLGQAAKDVVGGIGAGVRGTLQLPATALKMGGQALGGEPVDVPPDLMQQAQAYGESAPLTAAAAYGGVRAAPAIGRAAMAIPRGIIGGGLATALRALQQGVKESSPVTEDATPVPEQAATPQPGATPDPLAAEKFRQAQLRTQLMERQLGSPATRVKGMAESQLKGRGLQNQLLEARLQKMAGGLTDIQEPIEAMPEPTPAGATPAQPTETPTADLQSRLEMLRQQVRPELSSTAQQPLTGLTGEVSPTSLSPAQPGELVEGQFPSGAAGKAIRFAKGTRPEFKSGILQTLGEMASDPTSVYTRLGDLLAKGRTP